MKLGLDEYANLDSPIHRWEVRHKLVGLLVLVFALSFVQDLRLLPVMFLLTAGLFVVSKLPLTYLLNRLKLPGYFLLALAVLLPFVSGQTVLLSLGPITLRQEGVLAVVVIASRFVCIITVTLVLFGTAPFLESIKGLRALGIPTIIADMMLLTYRYLFEMTDHFNTMRTAIRLRGFKATDLSRRNLTVLAALVGSLLVRSYEQAEQVYKAMILRGYGYGQATLQQVRGTALDKALTAVALLVSGGLVGLQIWLS